MVANQDNLKINTKKLDRKNKNQACFEEMQAFFRCLTKNKGDIDGNCNAQRSALAECATVAAKKPNVRNTINYHLQRLSRSLRWLQARNSARSKLKTMAFSISVVLKLWKSKGLWFSSACVVKASRAIMLIWYIVLAACCILFFFMLLDAASVSCFSALLCSWSSLTFKLVQDWPSCGTPPHHLLI